MENLQLQALYEKEKSDNTSIVNFQLANNQTNYVKKLNFLLSEFNVIPNQNGLSNSESKRVINI